jgi:hypothetical protein
MLAKRNLFFFILIGILTTSCSIDEKFQFNSDLSGHYSFEFDYGAILALDSSGSANMEMDKGYIEMEEELKGIDGLSNIVVLSDNINGKVLVSYDFSTIDALNQANYNKESKRYNKFFSANKNKLQFTSDFSDELEEFKDPKMDDEELLENIESFIDYKMTFNFENKFKIIQLNNYTQVDDHTLLFTLTKESVLKANGFEIKMK